MDLRTVLLVRVSSAVDKVEHPQFFDPCYPLKYIQATLERQGVDVEVLDCWIRPTTLDTLLDLARHLRPDLLVVHSSSFDVDVANAFVTGLRRDGNGPLVLGIGQGQYLNREWCEGKHPAYDTILLGEPEEEFALWLDRVRTEDPGWRERYDALYRENHRFAVQDLDSLPFPRYTPDELRAYRSIYPVAVPRRVVWGFLIAGRGCPYACSFCSEVMRVSIGTKMRVRSGPNVVDEMENLVRQGANILSFQDDSFASSRRLVRSVCDELTRRGSTIPWMARARVDELDRETLERMKRAGCVMLGLGVEAGSQRIIDRVHKTYRSRPWADLARQVFRFTRELGIGTNAYYVLGSPTETRREIRQTIDLALELNADSIQVHFHTPYPGSADWNDYRDVLRDQDPTGMFHYATPRFSLAEVTPDELVELRSQFYRRYLFRPGFVLRHARRHARFYLHNPDIFWTLLGIRKVLRKRRSAAPVADRAAGAVNREEQTGTERGGRSAVG